jgi:ribosomal protein L14
VIFINTKLPIVDNTGGRYGRCIRITKRKKAIRGDLILMTLRIIRPNIKLRKLKKKLVKGDQWRAFIIKDRTPIVRIGHQHIICRAIGVLLYKTVTEMAGTRIYGPLNKEFKNKRFFSICSYVI